MSLKPGRIDAALDGRGSYAGKAYFFRGDSYVRYDWAADRADPGFPAPLSAWNLPGDFALGVDAAVNGDGPFAGKAYFFRGNQYVRYDWATDRVDAGYPAALSAWNLPGGFGAGIDAGCDGKAPHFGKAYFFRGNQYIRYDWATDRPDAGYPQPISAWNIPAPLSGAVSAVANGAGSYAGKAYFFGAEANHRTATYARYDWKTEKGDTGYPAPAAGRWPGLIELLDAGQARATALQWLDRALGALGEYGGKVALGVNDASTAQTEAALLAHFHLTRATFAAQAPAIIGTYAKVRAALVNLQNILRFRTDAEAKSEGGADAAGTPYPAYTFFNGTINVTTRFPAFGPLCQAAMMLHEPVHYVDAGADTAHDIYEHAPGYATVTAANALHNPSSYVCFAEQVFYGSDVRYGAGRPNE